MRRLWAVPVLALALAACGSDDPRAELRGDVEDVTLAANAGNPDGVRDAVEDLLDTIRRQVTERELDPDEGARLEAIALRIAENADLAAPPEPSPEPSPTEEEPSPEPPPSPSPEPSPEPEPSEEPDEPEEPEEPEESPDPIVEVSPVVTPAGQSSPQQEPSPSPAQVSQAASQPSSTSSPQPRR